MATNDPPVENPEIVVDETEDPDDVYAGMPPLFSERADEMAKYTIKDLKAKLRICKLPTTGNKQQLFSRWWQFIQPNAQANSPIPEDSNNPPTFTTDNNPPANANANVNANADATVRAHLYVPAPHNLVNTPTLLRSVSPNFNPHVAQTCDLVRRWNCRFNGKGDPIAFLERLQELKECYGITDAETIAALPELFQDSALLWYRNFRTQLNSWSSFLSLFYDYFAPQQFEYTLRREIYQRIQRPGENAQDYTTSILTLMRRCGLSEQEQLEVLFGNLRSEYKLYIRQGEARSVEDLLRRAREFEALQTVRTNTRSLAVINPDDTQQRSVTELRDNLPRKSQTPANSNNRQIKSLPPTSARCYKCHCFGHWSQTCPKDYQQCLACKQLHLKHVDCPCRKVSGNAKSQGY